MSFAVYKEEKPVKQPKTKQQKQTRQNKKQNKTQKLPKMKLLTWGKFDGKVNLEVKKPGKTEETLTREKIARLQNNQ